MTVKSLSDIRAELYAQHEHAGWVWHTLISQHDLSVHNVWEVYKTESHRTYYERNNIYPESDPVMLSTLKDWTPTLGCIYQLVNAGRSANIGNDRVNRIKSYWYPRIDFDLTTLKNILAHNTYGPKVLHYKDDHYYVQSAALDEVFDCFKYKFNHSDISETDQKKLHTTLVDCVLETQHALASKPRFKEILLESKYSVKKIKASAAAWSFKSEDDIEAVQYAIEYAIEQNEKEWPFWLNLMKDIDVPKETAAKIANAAMEFTPVHDKMMWFNLLASKITEFQTLRNLRINWDIKITLSDAAQEVERCSERNIRELLHITKICTPDTSNDPHLWTTLFQKKTYGWDRLYESQLANLGKPGFEAMSAACIAHVICHAHDHYKIDQLNMKKLLGHDATTKTGALALIKKYAPSLMAWHSLCTQMELPIESRMPMLLESVRPKKADITDEEFGALFQEQSFAL